MPNKIIAKSCGFATLALGIALSAAPAYAGFEWVAPSDGGTSQPPQASVYTAPLPPLSLAAPAPAPQSATNAPEIISPVIITGNAGPALAAPNAPTEPLSLAPSLSPPPSAPPVVLTMTPPPPPASKEGSKIDLSSATINLPSSPATAPASADIVQGFASQVPLALALRQVLPIGYSFSIDQGVDMDTLVSYKGGKPWGETLKIMLAPAGLVDHEQGTVVTISRDNAPALVRAPAPAPLVHMLPERATTQVNVLSPLRMASPVNVSPAEGWSAERGDTLRKVLTAWCRRAGVELQWLAEYDYPIEASAHFSRGFEDAVRSLLAGFDGARPQPIGELHTNTSAGQMVLVVQSRGNSYSN